MKIPAITALVTGLVALGGAAIADTPTAPDIKPKAPSASPAPAVKPAIPAVAPKSPAVKPLPTIIKKYLATMAGFKTLYVEGLNTTTTGPQSDVTKLTLAPPNKMRLESLVGGKTVAAIVSTGRTMSQWDSSQILKGNAPPSYAEMQPMIHLSPGAYFTGLMFLHPEAMTMQEHLQDKGDVIFSGQLARRLISENNQAKITIIISSATGLPLQLTMASNSNLISINFIHFKIDKPVAADAFAAPALRQPVAMPLPPIASHRFLKVGALAPDFTLSTVDGKAVTLSSLKGHVVLIDFWASWSAPCKMTMPRTQSIVHDFSDKGLTVLSVNSWDQKEELLKFLKDHGEYTSTILVDPAAEEKSVAAAKYGVAGVPSQFLIDRDGKVVSVQVGYEVDGETKLRAELAKVGIK